MSGWLLNTVSFSSPLIARPDTLWRQWTNLFIKSGVWLQPLRASLSSWYHSCGDKEQGTGDRHLYIRRQVPGPKRSPPPLIAEIPRLALWWGQRRFHRVPAALLLGFGPLAVSLFIFAKLEGFCSCQFFRVTRWHPAVRDLVVKGYYSKTQQDSATERRTPRISRSFDSVEWSNTKRQRDKETGWHLVIVPRAVFPCPGT